MTSSVVPPANDAAPTEVLELVHHHPGRLRVRAEVLRDDAELAGRVTRAPDGVPGITRVTHNTRTGSLLVEYEPGLAEPDAIAERIARTAQLISPFDPRAAKPVVRPASALFSACCTATSDSESRWAVASSRTTTEGAFSSSLARATRCFSPPDRR